MSTSAFLLLALASANASPDNILYDFSATWCGPCQQMHPLVHQLEREGLPIRQIDVDHNRNLVRQYGVGSIPAFVLVIDGKVAERHVGVTSESHLRQMLAKIPRPLPNPREKADDPKLASSNSRAPKQQRSIPVDNAVLVDNNGTPTGPSAKSIFQLPSLPPLFRKKRAEVAIEAPTQPAAEEAVVRGNLGTAQVTPPAATVKEAVDHPQQSDALVSSTRIRVKDEDGINFGSGTIIDSRPGRTVILTCGHIFRELKKDSTIEVDIFEAGRSEPYVGTLIDFDSDSDVGLIAIPTANKIPSVPVASLVESARKGDHVTSIGCGGGEMPTEQELRVTALNRYLGPENIECTGVPIQGRSGGGLFNADGNVIGVCIAADPKEQRGLYAGLQCIHDMLKKSGFAYLIGGRDTGVAAADTPAETSEDDTVELTSAANLKRTRSAANPETEDVADERSEQNGAEPEEHEEEFGESAMEDVAANADEPAELAGAGVGEAEIVCIIRPIGKTGAASRVVVINRASPKFVSYLTGEIQAQPQPTMKTVPHSPKVPDERESPKKKSAADRSKLKEAAGRIEARVVNRPDSLKQARFTRDPLVEMSIEDQSAQIVAVSVQETSVIPRRYRRSADSRE
ncbi:MAG: trypsin-like peptidase domain-containing protein [Planctomycetaceae bacterium]